jgi:hypothetical protein
MSTQPQNGSEIGRVVEDALADPACGWSIGTWGAVADLERDPGEPTTVTSRSFRTARGAVRVDLPDGVRAVAYERCLRPAGSWRQAIALCLPVADAAMAGRDRITALGEDTAALDPEVRTAELFDLGLGAACVDFCVRTADPELAGLLRAADGRSFWDPGHDLVGRVLAASPDRVLLTRLGRAEIATPIPPPGGTTPWGPHTHLLPKMLATGRTHPAIEPIPEGLVPVVSLFPAHPLVGPRGTTIPFDADRHDAFQVLLRTFGDPEHLRVKDEVTDAVLADRPAARPAPGPGSVLRSRAARVTLRQLTRTVPDAPGLSAWRTAFGEPVDGGPAAPVVPPHDPDPADDEPDDADPVAGPSRGGSDPAGETGGADGGEPGR